MSAEAKTRLKKMQREVLLPIRSFLPKAVDISVETGVSLNTVRNTLYGATQSTPVLLFIFDFMADEAGNLPLSLGELKKELGL